MKKNNKKGFTLVELVIVIAVIAILAAVLIPTFTTVIANANKSAALQEGTNLKTEILELYAGDFNKYCDDYVGSRSDPVTVTVTDDLTILKSGMTGYAADGSKFSTFISDFSKVTAMTITKSSPSGSGKIEYTTSSKYKVTITVDKVEVVKV